MHEGNIIEFISGLKELLEIFVILANIDYYDALGFQVFDLLGWCDEFWLSSNFFLDPVDNSLFSSYKYWKSYFLQYIRIALHSWKR